MGHDDRPAPSNDQAANPGSSRAGLGTENLSAVQAIAAADGFAFGALPPAAHLPSRRFALLGAAELVR
jgi:hypothetical protein